MYAHKTNGWRSAHFVVKFSTDGEENLMDEYLMVHGIYIANKGWIQNCWIHIDKASGWMDKHVMVECEQNWISVDLLGECIQLWWLNAHIIDR